MSAEDVDEFSDSLMKKLATEMRTYRISAATGSGCDVLAQAIYQWIEKQGIEERQVDKVQENSQKEDQEDLIDE
jgi:hypothetical protein